MVVAFNIETMDPYPSKAKILLLGIKKGRGIKQWKLWETQDEAMMILELLADIDMVSETIVGYQNLNFDVPFMFERLRILGRYRPEFFKIYRKKWFDLYHYLGDNFTNLEQWCAQAKIQKKHPELKGKDLSIFFQKKDYQKIVDHNIDDLETSEKLFEFFRKRNPELVPFE